MSRIHFDQLAKQYLEGFLEPLGTVQRNLEIPGEPKFVDLWFTPHSVPQTSIDLGLLSRIATTPCLLEPFSKAPTRQDIKSCLLKLLWVQEHYRRKSKREGDAPTQHDLPKLWVVAATTTQPMITEFGGAIQPAWGDGIYHFPVAYGAAIVAIDQLPVTLDTLWLRILGRDQVQQQAIAELLTLPRSDPQRDQVLELLANWKVTLELGELKLSHDEESRLMVQLSQAYLEWKQERIQEGLQQGVQQGIQQGRLEGELKMVLKLLDRRFGPLKDDRRSQIRMLSLQQIEDLTDRLLDFNTDADLTLWLQQLNDRLAEVNDRLRQQWADLPPDLQTQVQHLSSSQLITLLEALPQLANQEDLSRWLQTQHLTD